MGVCVSNDAKDHCQGVLVFGLMARLFQPVEFRTEFAVTGDFDEGLMGVVPAWVRESKTLGGMVVHMATTLLTRAGLGGMRRPPGLIVSTLRPYVDASESLQPESRC